MPIYEWLFDKLGEKAKMELLNFCDETDFLDKAEVENLFKRGDGTLIWVLLNFSLWWNHYIKVEPVFKGEYLIKKHS